MAAASPGFAGLLPRLLCTHRTVWPTHPESNRISVFCSPQCTVGWKTGPPELRTVCETNHHRGALIRGWGEKCREGLPASAGASICLGSSLLGGHLDFQAQLGLPLYLGRSGETPCKCVPGAAADGEPRLLERNLCITRALILPARRNADISRP